jgi:uncharacterized protein YaaW (UPF0174 family)
MVEDRNSLKLIKSEGNSTVNDNIPTPRTLRVRRLKTIHDASKLIARTTAELQKGFLSVERAKAIGFLAQVFISSIRQSVEEKTFDEILKTKFMILQKEAVRLFDLYIRKIQEKSGLAETELQKIATEFQGSLKMDPREWKKFVDEVKEEILTQTNFKMKILSEEKPEEIKKLIAFRLRQMPEDERVNFINEIITESGWTK